MFGIGDDYFFVVTFCSLWFVGRYYNRLVVVVFLFFFFVFVFR